MLTLNFWQNIGIEFETFKNDVFSFFKNIYVSVENILTKYMGEDALIIISIFLIAIFAIFIFRSIINK